jgi:membrane fusion protein, copper/silver efflux system
VWVLFDAYESDLPFLNKGDKVSFTVQALPGTDYSGNISFIDPVLDPVSRVAKVRVEINNESGRLKPEMFANGTVKANLDTYRNNLVIPRSAVLWTGKRSIVYVKQPGTDEPIFKMREIELGPMLGNSYVVTDGLKEGEEIVTQGTFSVDAAAQLEGRPSMMNPSPANAPVEKPEGGAATMKTMQEMKMNSEEKVSEQIKPVSFKVWGNCEMCKDRIERAATSLDGVLKADWDKETKFLTLTINPSKIGVDKVQSAIAGVGHDTEKYMSTDEAYNALPACCKYERRKE